MKLKPLFAFALLPLIGFAADVLNQDVSIQLDHGEFHLTGVPNLAEPADGWISLFTVSTTSQDAPAMLGSYALENGALIFRPRFPLANGIRYRAVYRAANSQTIEKLFDGPAPAPHPPTRVIGIYPSINVLPANQLKLYLYFSAPIQRGGVWNHIHLLDNGGRPVNLAFLELDQELWDAQNQRLTVLFDPGRIKRGVAPERDIGPPIVPGKTYTLQIDSELLDAGGQPLAETYRKEFQGAPAIRSGLDLKDWQISAPAAGSKAPLVVNFPRPLDYALLEHAITVKGDSGAIAGRIAIDHEERQWRFTPAQPWRSDDYQLIVDPELEDLAGNRIGRPFDRDLSKGLPEARSNPVTLRVRIGTR